MRAAERAGPRVVPALPPPDAHALPGVRLVTGLVALAILALPAGRHVAEWTARPIPDRVITVAALPPLEAAIAQASQPAEPSLLDSALPPSASAGTTARARSVSLPAQPKAVRAKAAARRSVGYAGTGRAAPASMRVARARPALTRAQVVRAYLASREQVAALTREDSGSVYLTRVAARRKDRSFTR